MSGECLMYLGRGPVAVLVWKTKAGLCETRSLVMTCH